MTTEAAPVPEEPIPTEEVHAASEQDATGEAPAPSEQEDPAPPVEDSGAGVPAIVNDAPVRNAHHRDAFESTEQARRVKIHNAETGADIEFSCEPDEFVLDAAERAGHELPYSCRSGGCLSCTGLIVAGTTRMTEEQYVLEDDHIERGFTLLCITIVDTDAEFLSQQEDAVE
ncbi:MAG: 2Fe-2S iron-sulfur cluster-binding protein [Myxococcota bacterium]|nr:2Fe-2S iron-sulfur cluster-binding protein [Myxococcota bacterium]